MNEGGTANGCRVSFWDMSQQETSRVGTSVSLSPDITAKPKSTVQVVKTKERVLSHKIVTRMEGH